jgi:hypothetical protein
MARKPIPKTIRFEVFKRDKFTCQYCGASAPDVILEVDHIKPVSKGGTNDILNLVTACRHCNRGKTNKELSDNSAIKVQKQQLDDMQERREQLKMMLAWREELELVILDEVNYIQGLIFEGSDMIFTDAGINTAKRLLKQFGFSEVCEACEIARNHYFRGRYKDLGYAWKKVGGICYNRKKARDEDA